ncbi:MAG: Hsp20/alpha crystallin family protein [Saprospiraceae bacterium]
MYNTMNSKPGFHTRRDFRRHPMHYAPTVLANVVENDKHYQIQMAIPGYQKDQIDISIAENTLTIAGKANENEQEQIYTRKEFASGNFSRKFTLPKGTNAENISAEYANSILLITITKTPDAQPIKVNIQ